jgi:hypothetical protein
MAKVCHRHCPDEGGALLAAVLAVILTAVLAVIAAQVIESLFVAIVITGSVLGAAGIAFLAYVLHRDRARAPVSAPRAMPAYRLAPPRTAQAISAPQLRAIGAPADAWHPGIPSRDKVTRDAAPR